MPDLPAAKLVSALLAAAVIAAAFGGCGGSTDARDRAAANALPIRFLGAPVAEGVVDPSTADKRVFDVLQVVFRLDKPMAVGSRPVLIAADVRSVYLSRYGTTLRCYSADIPIYDRNSTLAAVRAGDTLPITLTSRAGTPLASTSVLARPLLARPTLYRVAERMGCRRPSRAQTRPRMTLSTDMTTRITRVVCVNDKTERLRGSAVCNGRPDRAGVLRIRARGRILIRVPGKIIGMGLRDFDPKTKNAPLLDTLRPRRTDQKNLWSVRLPSRLDRRTNYLNIDVLLPRQTYVTYEINVRQSA